MLTFTSVFVLSLLSSQCRCVPAHPVVPSFQSGIARGEGLMTKSLSPLSQYLPDFRTDSWVKLKRDYIAGLSVGDSLDVACPSAVRRVISTHYRSQYIVLPPLRLLPYSVASHSCAHSSLLLHCSHFCFLLISAWWGNGRKAGWYSPVLLAVYNSRDRTARDPVQVHERLHRRPTTSSSSASFAPRVIPRPKPYYVVDEQLWPQVWFDADRVWEITRGRPHGSARSTRRAGGRWRVGVGLALRFPRFIV